MASLTADEQEQEDKYVVDALEWDNLSILFRYGSAEIKGSREEEEKRERVRGDNFLTL